MLLHWMAALAAPAASRSAGDKRAGAAAGAAGAASCAPAGDQSGATAKAAINTNRNEFPARITHPLIFVEGRMLVCAGSDDAF
jgi:hypothetical protein